MRGLWMHVLEIPEVVMCSLSLWDLIMWLWLHSMDWTKKYVKTIRHLIDTRSNTLQLTEIRKLYRILNKEHRNIIPHQIPVPFLCIELDRETPYIPNGIRAPLAPLDSWETDKDWCITGCVVQDSCRGHICRILEELEITKGSSAASVYDSLRDTLVVEAMDLKCSLSGRR